MSTIKRARNRRVSFRAHGERGSILIEALVAMLIFLLGILGLIGLQSAMTREQTESKVRTEAAFLADEVVSRMWGDLTNVAAYSGGGCAGQTQCREWMIKVAQVLPAGVGAVLVDSSTGDVEVTITWKVANGQAHKYVTHTTVVKAGG
jgi:type IV pilus assembly protein PilV